MSYNMAIGLPLAAPPDPFQRPQTTDGVNGRFYMGALHDEAASLEAGRPIWRDVPFIEISSPGDRNNVLEHPVTQRDIQRFPQEYAAFKAGMTDDAQVIGTRLSDWTAMTPALIRELAYFNIRTVENIAEVRDDVCTRMPGLRRLKELAAIYLEKASVTAEATRLDSLIHGLQNDNEALRKAVAEQATMLEALQKKKA